MNEVHIRFKNSADGLLMITKANDVSIKEGYIHLRFKSFLGMYRTVAIIEKDVISTLMIKSEELISVNKCK